MMRDVVPTILALFLALVACAGRAQADETEQNKTGIRTRSHLSTPERVAPKSPPLRTLYETMKAFRPGRSLEQTTRLILSIDRKNLKDPRARLRLARCYCWVGRAFQYDDNPIPARIAYQQALALAPDDPYILTALADTERSIYHLDAEDELVEKMRALPEDKKTAGVYLCMAKNKMSRFDMPEAKKLIGKAEELEAPEGSVPLLMVQSRVMTIEGIGPESIENIIQAANLTENPYMKEILLANAAFLNLDSDSQKEHLDKALELYPYDPVCHIKLGQYYEGHVNPNEAYNQFFKAVNCRRHSSVAFLELARHYANQKKYNSALHTVRYIRRLMPSTPGIESIYSDVLKAKGDKVEALKHSKIAVQHNPDQFSPYVQQANLLNELGKKEAGLALIQKFTERHPDHWHAQLFLADLEYRSGKKAAAVETAKRGLALLPPIEDRNVLAKYLSSKACAIIGTQNYESGDLEQALAEAITFNRLKFLADLPPILTLVHLRPRRLEFDPKLGQQDPMGHAALADMLYEVGDMDNCIKEYREAVELLPDDTDLHSYLLHALSRKGDWIGAAKENIILSDRVVKHIPGQITGWGSKKEEKEASGAKEMTGAPGAGQPPGTGQSPGAIETPGTIETPVQ